MRNTLVTALASCAECSGKLELREFLAGLSFDELQFIAEFRGACILDSLPCGLTRPQLAELIARYQYARHARGTSDEDHKSIVLLEYLYRAGARQTAAAQA